MRAEVEFEPSWGSGKIANEIYDVYVEDKLLGPSVVIDHAREVSPLAEPHRSDPALVDRFEVVIDGRELANAYSELNDPIDRRARFEEQAAPKAAGDLEASDVDEDAWLTGVAGALSLLAQRDKREVARQGARARAHDAALGGAERGHRVRDREVGRGASRARSRADAGDLANMGILYAGVEGFLNVPVIGHLLVPQVVTDAGPR